MSQGIPTEDADLLVSRSIPNQRLVEVFGIDNAFTTTDLKYKEEFVGNVYKKLPKHTDSSQWQAMANSAGILARTELEKVQPGTSGDNDAGLLISPLIQRVTFRFVFDHVVRKFYPSASMCISDGDVERITESINKLWLCSKDVVWRNQSKHERDSIQVVLRNMVGINTSDPHHNPLNIVLPAWETLWRIVLRCLIEVTRHDYAVGNQGTSGTRSLLPMFSDFLKEPMLDNFRKPLDQNTNISLENIISEALRLHPPTRRIHRAITYNDLPRQCTVAAIDVELLHRDKEIWGDDAYEFKPARWTDCSVPQSIKQMKAFKPFGLRPFVCPAKSIAGPWFIALLTGKLARELGARKLCRWDDEDVMTGKILDGDRGAYARLRVVGDLRS